MLSLFLYQIIRQKLILYTLIQFVVEINFDINMSASCFLIASYFYLENNYNNNIVVFNHFSNNHSNYNKLFFPLYLPKYA